MRTPSACRSASAPRSALRWPSSPRCDRPSPHPPVAPMPNTQAFKDAFKIFFKSKGAIERRAAQRRSELRDLLEDIDKRIDDWRLAHIGTGYLDFVAKAARIEESLATIEDSEETSYIRLGKLIQQADKHLDKLRKKQTEAAS